MRIGVAGPIDITLLRDLFPPGAELPEVSSHTLTSLLIREFRRLGHDVSIFMLSRGVAKTTVLVGDWIRAHICPERRPRSQMLDFFREERRGLADAMRSSGCEIIHAFWTYEFAAGAIESGLPHLVTAQDVPTVVLRFARHPYWLEKPFLAWGVLRKARCITTVSPYAASALRRFTKGSSDIHVVPNPVAPAVFALRDNCGSRKPTRPFTFASILNEWAGRKNGNRLLEAFALLRGEYGDAVELIMFGKCHQRGGPAERWAARHGLQWGVHFAGNVAYLEMLTTLAQKADVLVHPALEESFGMAVAEAMAIGLPVIGGIGCGAVPWVLADGEAGLLADVRSPASIASAMRTLMEHDGLRNRLSESGRRRALDHYSLEVVAAQYEDVLAKARQEQAP